MFISSLKSHALQTGHSVVGFLLHKHNVSFMSPLANILSYREIMSAFHFHYRLCLTPKRKVELKARPFPSHTSIDAPTAFAIPNSFKPSVLKHKTINISLQPGATGVDIMQHTSYKREVVVGQWFYSGLILQPNFNNGRNFNQQKDAYELLYYVLVDWKEK